MWTLVLLNRFNVDPSTVEQVVMLDLGTVEGGLNVDLSTVEFGRERV
jgi:hypothetical protein